MTEFLVSGNSLPEAYHSALKALYEHSEITPCPDYNTTQKECSMTICIQSPMAEPMISRLFIGGPRELEQSAGKCWTASWTLKLKKATGSTPITPAWKNSSRLSSGSKGEIHIHAGRL